MSGMLEWEEARRRVIDGVDVGPVVQVPTLEAGGMALAEDVVAGENMPPFANSAMDGFAVRARDVAGASPEAPRTLPLAGTLAAGNPGDLVVEPGQAARIMTGAPVPRGADAVIPVEKTNFWDAGAARSRLPAAAEEEGAVIFFGTVPVGSHIRAAGESVRAGEVMLTRGKRLRSHDLALLISVGMLEVNVHSLPVVAVLSTGDELVSPEETPGPGRIRDSNRPGLLQRLRECGFPSLDLGFAPDDEAEIETRIRRGAAEAGFLLTSGGVSVGDFDLTRKVLDRIGEVSAYRVAVKPGKPQLFGRVGETPVFGLPGNPVSSLVVFDQFVLPALKKMAGRRTLFRPTFHAVMGERLLRAPGRVEFVRVRLETRDGSWIAVGAGPQGSGVLSSLSRANAYAILPKEAETVEAGTPVLCQPFDWD